ncbi:hypothetical protein HY480_03565, partial [Candidatus Uhrbacteria bacterium]|nr:hypothetical protein [Candidatus Uhrbacteria bacterium]
MQTAIALGKRSLTWSVVVATIAWSMGLSLLIAPLAAGAQASGLTSGSLIKGSLPAVYYYGGDGKRYVFPNEKTYKTWYADFSGVQTVSDATLASVAIGGNVTYRPGTKMVKITTDPKVYAVGASGTLRWVSTEAVATALFGASWASMVEDVPDAFFVNYTVGTSVAAAADYNKDAVLAAASSINTDKNLGGTAPAAPVGPAVMSAMDGGSPASATIPALATNVIFAKLKLSGSGTVSGLKVTRTGLAADTDLSNVKIFDGTTQLGTSQTLNAAHQAVFTGLAVAVSGDKTLTIAGDVAAIGTGAATAGDLITLGIESAADITLASGSASGTFPIRGGAMTVSSVTIGGATLFRGADMPTTDNQPAPDAVDYRFTQVRIQAGSTEDITVKQVTAIQAGTATTSDIKDVKLKNDTSGTIIATLPTLPSNGRAVFDNLNIAVKKGENLNLSILATLAGGSSSGRTVAFELHDGVAYTVQIVGNTYGFGITPTRNDFCATTGVTGGACQIQTVATGTLRLTRASSSPAPGTIAQGATAVPLLAVDFTATGEAVRITSQNWDFTLGTMTCSELTSVTLFDKDGVVAAGPKDCASNSVTFTESMTVPVGTSTYTLKGNIASSTSGSDTLLATLDVSEFTAKGVNSGKATTVSTTTDVAGNTLTVQAASLAATTLATPIAGSVVANVKGFGFANFVLDASAGGEDAKVASVTVADATSATALPGDLVNYELWGDSDTTDANDAVVRIDTTNSTATATYTANTAGIDSTVTFTFKTPLRISKTKSATYQVRADVISTAVTSATHTLDVSAVSATGWTTGSSVTMTDGTQITGAGQAQTVQASGTLKVELAADRTVAGPVVAGSSGVSMVKYKLTAAYEDVDITELPLYLANGTTGAGTLANVAKVKVYSNGTQLGNLAGYTFDNAAKVTVTLDSSVLRAVKDVPLYVELKADFNAKEQTTSGSQARVGIGDSDSDASTWNAAGNYNITANGKDSGTALTKANIDDVGDGSGNVNGGSALGVFDGVLTVGLDANSPSGVQTAGTGKEVLRFWLTATGDEITVHDLEFIPSSSGTVTGTGDAKLQSTDGSITYADWTSAATECGNGSAGGICFAVADFHVNDADTSTTRDGSGWTTALTVGAGQTKVVKVTGDTTGVASQKTFQLRIDDGGTTGAGLQWMDNELNGLNGTSCTAAATDRGAECVVDSATYTKT